MSSFGSFTTPAHNRRALSPTPLVSFSPLPSDPAPSDYYVGEPLAASLLASSNSSNPTPANFTIDPSISNIYVPRPVSATPGPNPNPTNITMNASSTSAALLERSREAIRNLHAEVNTERERRQQLMNEILELRREIEKHKSCKETIDMQQETIKHLTEEMEKYKHNEKKWKSRADKLEKEWKQKYSQLEGEARGLSADGRWQGRCEELEQQLEQERIVLREATQKMELLQKQLAVKSQELNESVALLTKQESQLNELRSNRERNKEQALETYRLQLEAHYRTEQESLLARCSAIASDRERLSLDLLNEKEERAKLSSAIELLKSQNNKLVDALRQGNEGIANSWAESSTKIKSEFDRRLNSTDSRIDAVVSKQKALTELLTRYHTQIKKLQAESTAKSKRCDELQLLLDRESAQCSAFSQALHERTLELDRARVQYHQLQQAAQKSQTDGSQLAQEKQVWERSRLEFETNYRTALTQLEAFRKRAEELERELSVEKQNARRREQDYEKDLARMTSREEKIREAVTKKIAKLQKQIEEKDYALQVTQSALQFAPAGSVVYQEQMPQTVDGDTEVKAELLKKIDNVIEKLEVNMMAKQRHRSSKRV